MRQQREMLGSFYFSCCYFSSCLHDCYCVLFLLSIRRSLLFYVPKGRKSYNSIVSLATILSIKEGHHSRFDISRWGSKVWRMEDLLFPLKIEVSTVQITEAKDTSEKQVWRVSDFIYIYNLVIPCVKK